MAKTDISPHLIEEKASPQKKLLNEIWINRHKYVLIMPYAVLFAVFVIVPIISALILSFTNFNMLETPEFIGVANYLRMFLDDDVLIKAVKNTVIFAFITGPISYMMSLLLAWFINELSSKTRSVLTLVFYAPTLAGNVFFIWMYIFSGDAYGLVNSWFLRLGITMEPVQWLTDPKYIMFIIILVQLWLSLGAGFLAFIAGLQSVDRGLYEAGALDGIRNRWQELWHITLPSMKPILLFGAVMQIAATFSVSGVPMTLAGFPSTDDAAATVVSHIIDHGTLRFEMGYASAIATGLFVVMILTKMIIGNLLSSNN
ncbi:sugar ABC transporter permease [Candidatus Nomurabacteria bacterium]|nr:sugar ABC transporter permease [Candidatus Nomurabacteria bacterium]